MIVIMSIIKSFSVGNGDMFYIKHNSDNFTIIDCYLKMDNKDQIIEEIKEQSKAKTLSRFISTHPDEDHFGGIHWLDDVKPIQNFYVVKNNAIKSVETDSFKRYCTLRDDKEKAYYIEKGCTRKWMNLKDENRGSSGISILWPNLQNAEFQKALEECNQGNAFNNLSAVIRYEQTDGASVLWLGDLETEFMESIIDDINLTKTTIVFAAHHGRESGKVPDCWLEKLDPQIIVIGEAKSRHLHYYTGYQKLTQNRAGDITMELVGNKVHFYSSKPEYTPTAELDFDYQDRFENYFGTITVETEYTL